MHYTIDSAEWPTGVEVRQPVIALMERMYRLLDDPNPKSGNILADEIFSADGVASFGAFPFRGTDEIRRSRAHAWDKIKSRRHEILRVYVCSAAADDLLFIARVKMELKNGREVEGEFTGRLVISGVLDSQPKVKVYQVWGDTSALSKALAEG